MQMAKPCARQQVTNQPLKKGLQKQSLYAPASPYPNRDASTTVFKGGNGRMGLPLLECGGYSTGVPSSADDDSSLSCSTPGTPPIRPMCPPPAAHEVARPRNQKKPAGNKAPVRNERNVQKPRQMDGRNKGKRDGGAQPKFCMGVVLSRGSKNHALGQCRPCQQAGSPEGCDRGALCNFCHYPHDEAKMVEVAVYSAKARLNRLVSDDEGSSINLDDCYDMPSPTSRMMSPSDLPTSLLEPWYVSCESVPQIAQFQRLSL